MTRSIKPRRRRGGYTLIELLVVTGIIIVLVSLIFPVTAALKKKREITVAQAELKQVITFIEAYKSKLGLYPPDNPGNPVTNQLYFELAGTYRDPTALAYTTIDGSSRISSVNIVKLYNFGSAAPGPRTPTGFVNASASQKATDESAAAINFLAGLRPTQIGQVVIGRQTALNPPFNALLVCSVKWQGATEMINPALTPYTKRSGLNPWRYVSSSPTNNPGSYDLWVDFVIGSSVYRVSNWSKDPQVVGTD